MYMNTDTQEEIETNIQNHHHSAYSTKRFKLYRRIMSLFFNPAQFLHVQNIQCSAYLMANRDYLYPNNESMLKKIIERMKASYPDEIEEDGF